MKEKQQRQAHTASVWSSSGTKKKELCLPNMAFVYHWAYWWFVICFFVRSFFLSFFHFFRILSVFNVCFCVFFPFDRRVHVCLWLFVCLYGFCLLLYEHLKFDPARRSLSVYVCIDSATTLFVNKHSCALHTLSLTLSIVYVFFAFVFPFFLFIVLPLPACVCAICIRIDAVWDPDPSITIRSFVRPTDPLFSTISIFAFQSVWPCPWCASTNENEVVIAWLCVCVCVWLTLDELVISEQQQPHTTITWKEKSTT